MEPNVTPDVRFNQQPQLYRSALEYATGRCPSCHGTYQGPLGTGTLEPHYQQSPGCRPYTPSQED